jgi:hypothetical protein
MMALAAGPAEHGSHVDFDLHGVVGVRVLDGRPRAAAAIAAQLGNMVRPLTRVPDITIRFVPQISTPGLRYVELGRSGFTEDGFLVLSHLRRPVRVRMPFDRMSGPYEIECEHGPFVPLLDSLIKLAALRHGYVPVHASAFHYEGSGVLVAGWAHGGKTSCLLAFAEGGASFISDDLVLLRGDGARMFGVPAPISMADWQLDQLPDGRRRLGRLRRILLAGVRPAERLTPRLGDGAVPGAVRTIVAGLARRLKVQLPAEAVFGRVGPYEADPDRIFVAMSHASPDIEVEPVDPAIVAKQLATAFRLELHAAFEQYLAFRFAFPDRRSDLLENAEAVAETLLARALAGKAAFVVRHPHPVSLAMLQRAMHPYVAETRRGHARMLSAS